MAETLGELQYDKVKQALDQYDSSEIEGPIMEAIGEEFTIEHARSVIGSFTSAAEDMELAIDHAIKEATEEWQKQYPCKTCSNRGWVLRYDDHGLQVNRCLGCNTIEHRKDAWRLAKKALRMFMVEDPAHAKE